MCGEFHNRTGIRMLNLIRPAHDRPLKQADQPAEQGSNSMDDVLNLAQVKAELSYLNRLDQRRETNVESLKRLKEARDALLVRGGEVAGAQSHEVPEQDQIRSGRDDGSSRASDASGVSAASRGPFYFAWGCFRDFMSGPVIGRRFAPTRWSQ
jgi:hypothetical protein